MQRTKVLINFFLIAGLLVLGFGAPAGWGNTILYGAPSVQPTVPTLSVGGGITAQPSGTVAVPISFETGGANNIGSMAFTLQFDTSCLAVDTTDTDLDGVPDAMSFNPALPGVFAKTVLLDNIASGHINVALFSLSPAAVLPSLIPLVTMTFSVTCTPPGASQAAPITFPVGTASFGSNTGQSIPGNTVDGIVTIQGTATPTNTELPTATPTNTDVPPLVTNTPTATPLSQLPGLIIAGNPATQTGNQVTVPIAFQAGDMDVVSVVFSIDFDETCLAFDPTDANADLIPDAITFAQPGGYSPSVTYAAADTDGELDFVIADLQPPFTPLSSFTPLASITFTAICTPAGASQAAAVNFSTDPAASFGGPTGNNVAGTTTNGSVIVTPAATATPTNTPVVPTSTPTNTPVVPTNTPTNTPIAPTDTPTNTPVVPTSTPTDTPVPQLPHLSIASNVAAQTGSAVSVPIGFSAGTKGVSTLIFSVDFDETCLAFDPTDGNNDGIPDALTASLPTQFTLTVEYNAADTDGELDIAIADVAPPLSALPSLNPLIAIAFTAVCSPAAGTQIAPVNFSTDPAASFGGTNGRDVPGDTTDGSVIVTAVATSTPTDTPVVPTDTPTYTPVAPTDTPTDTPVAPTDTPTYTPVAPTDTPTPDACVPLMSLLKNPGFEDGTNHWEFYTSGSGHFTTGVPAYECTKAAIVQIDQRGTNMQLYQTGFPLEPNSRYLLSFAAKSSSGNDMGVFIQEHDEDYTNYGLRQRTVPLTMAWQEFRYEFTTTGFSHPVTDTRIRFWFVNNAQIGDVYMIDKVILKKVDGTPPTHTPTPTPTTPGVPTHTPTPTPTTPGTCTPAASILHNQSFEMGTAAWEFYTTGSGSWTTTGPGYECDAAAKVTITQPGVNVQLYQDGFTFILHPNTRYRLHFAAKSNTGHDMGVFIHEHDDDFTNYGLSVSRADLNHDWQEFSYEFTTKGFNNPVNDGRVRFWFARFAEANDIYWIDKVVLEAVGGATAAGEEENIHTILLPNVQR